jgi:hypothetical protein
MLVGRRATRLAWLGLFVAALGCSDDSSPADDDGGGGAGASGAGSTTSGQQTTTSTTTSGQSTTGTGGTGGSGGTCAPVPTCDGALPDVGPERDWIHTTNQITAATGFANHRGRDMIYNPGDDIWVMAKFAYGVLDDDIQDEDVDIYLNRDCGADWELLGTARTTDDGEHPTVEGVEDTGGWVFFQAPSNLALGEGRHRFLMVVAGDLSTADVFIDIVQPGTPIIVTDVDGTLTTSENEEFTALLTGAIPDANPSAPEVLNALADKGYRIFYMTARPHFLVGRTREFIDVHGFPPGLVHTSLSLTGATGSSAVTYKTGELAMLAARGLVPAWACGNTITDAEAYDNGAILPLEQRIMYQFTDDMWNARRVDDYAELLPEIAAAADPVCP